MSKTGTSKAFRAAQSRYANFTRKPRASLEPNSPWQPELTYSLSQHTPEVSAADLLLSRDSFPMSKEGDILEIRPEESPVSFVLQLSSGSLISGKSPIISVSKAISTAFNLPGRDCLVHIQSVSNQEYEIEAIVFSIKDQFISRRDMAKIERNSIGKAFYRSQKTTLLGTKLVVTDILVGGKLAMSGVFTGKTVVTFRSKSCRAVWLVEISQEMWAFTPEGYLLLERALWFIRCALERSFLLGVSHNISIVAFARLFYPKITAEEAALHSLSTSPEGLYYLDVCKEVCEIGNSRLSLKSAFPGIKREIFTFVKELNWVIEVPTVALSATKVEKPPQRLPGRLSASRESCVLEVINVALNRFEYHTQDRKLVNTGQCILVVSAGVGAYQSTSTTVKLTKERITNSAVILDIVSVNHKPLHISPVFVYSLERLRQKRDKAREAVDKETYELYLNYSEARPQADKGISRPTWLRMHFFSSAAQLEGGLNIQSALHTMSLTRSTSQPTALVSFSCFDKPANTSLSHVNSKLSYSLKDAVSNARVLNGLITEVDSPLIGIQPQTLNQIAMQNHLQAFCKAFDDRVFSGNKEEEVNFPSPSMEKRKLDRYSSSGTDRKAFRGTMITAMEPSVVNPQGEIVQRKFSEASMESMKELDSPRRNSIHDMTGGKVVHNSQTNPFLTRVDKKRFSRFTRRWARLFPGTVPNPPDTVENDPFCEKSVTFFEAVWRLLLEPAILPLTSDFWPGNEELGSSNPTQTSISPSCPLQKDTLVRELVGLRLQKEFQLVTQPIDRLGRKVHLNPNAYYLSRGRSDHVILPSLQDDYNVDFRIYTLFRGIYV